MRLKQEHSRLEASTTLKNSKMVFKLQDEACVSKPKRSVDYYLFIALYQSDLYEENAEDF